MTVRRLPAPTLLDLIDAVYAFTESREEAAALVNQLFRTGRVRFRVPWPPALGAGAQLPGHL